MFAPPRMWAATVRAVLFASTIFSAYHAAGARVALVTAKDKLRALLGAGLFYNTGRAICFSSERADQSTEATNGIDDASTWLNRPVPDVYSAELSEFVLAAGIKFLQQRDVGPALCQPTSDSFVRVYAVGTKPSMDVVADDP